MQRMISPFLILAWLALCFPVYSPGADLDMETVQKGGNFETVTNDVTPQSGSRLKDQYLTGKNGQAKLMDQDVNFNNISGMERPPDKLAPTIPDLLIVRPLAAIGAMLSTSAFLATLPVTYPLGKDLKVTTVLMEKPWDYVADRPLGVFVPEKSISSTIDEKISEQYQDYYGRVSANRSPIDLK